MGIQERKEREKERRRQQIIVAAKRAFSDKGFNKATMEDIAKEAAYRISATRKSWIPAPN